MSKTNVAAKQSFLGSTLDSQINAFTNTGSWYTVLKKIGSKTTITRRKKEEQIMLWLLHNTRFFANSLLYLQTLTYFRLLTYSVFYNKTDDTELLAAH